MFLNFFITYTIAFSTTLFLCVYVLRIPQIITNQTKLVNQYYHTHFKTSVPLDYILVLIYVCIAKYVIALFQIKRQIYKIAIIIVATSLITGSFCYYYRLLPMSSQFFSKWFHKAGYMSIVYDIILLVMTYMIMEYIIHCQSMI